MTIAAHVNAATAHFSRGDYARARTEAEQALRKQPGSPGILQLLGIICCQSGDLGTGVVHLRNSLRRGGDTPDARLNLARALTELGQYEEAEALCRPKAGEEPNAALVRMLAQIYKAQGRPEESARLYEVLVAEQPNDFESWNNLGTARLEQGDLTGAIAALEQARVLQPAASIIHLNLGRAYTAAGWDEQGLGSFEEAVRRAPNDPVALLELGQALQRLGRPADALAPLGTAARLDPKNDKIFVALGLTFAALRQIGQAERAYRFALQANPRSGPAYLNLAILLEQANRTDELEALGDAALAGGAAGDEIDYVQALVLRRQGRLEEALALAQGAFPESLDATLKALFVGQVADRVGDVDTAFSAFFDMNQITASTPEAARFDGSEHRQYVEDLLGVTTKPWFDSWRPALPDLSRPAPAVLAGFLRTGSTLLDTILMGHPGTQVLEEEPILAQIEDAGGTLDALPRMGTSDVNTLRRRYFAAVEALGPVTRNALIVDKNPLATLRAPLIHRIFPDARFIFTLRHPCDVVLSCYMQNFQINQAMASFLDLTNAALFYDRVMTYWERCREIMPLNVHTIRYEDMVEDVEGSVRPLLDFLGLDWDPRVLDHQQTASERGYIRTPSYAQVTEKIYARASGRWVRYRRYLEPIVPILAPWAERFGYSVD